MKYVFSPLIPKNIFKYNLIVYYLTFLVHICERWATDRTDGMQYAFFNGMGYESWENVWGVFNQITPRDGAALKRTSKILRQFGEFIQGGSKWTPHLPVSRFHAELHSKTFARQFNFKTDMKS